jgi:CubicO group peptidase (beta-lactamase class C family)
MKEQISKTIQTAINENRIIGAVVLVAKEGKLICETAGGSFDAKAGIPMKTDAIFRLASVTKLYVAVATMILVSKDKLTLDDTVDQFLPYFRPALVDGSIPKITIRQLFSHTSGLGYGFLEKEDGPLHLAGVSDGMDTTQLSLEENLRRLATVPLIFNPGSAWLYSLSFDVLGGVLEQIENKPLAEIIRSLITQPLHLNDTGFEIMDHTRLAPAYMNAIPAPIRMQSTERISGFEGMAPVLMSPDRAFQKNAFPSGGSGMLGSAGDLLTLLEYLRISLSFAEMSKSQTHGLTVAGWPGWSYGLGFSVLTDATTADTPESVGTWRWGGAYGHSWFVDPVQQLSVVAFTNTALEGMSGGGRFPIEIRDTVYRIFN